MLKGLIGKKIGMTQIFDEQGVAYPVTIIEAGPCYVTQVRNQERDGYVAVQLGFGEIHPKKLASGELGSRSPLPHHSDVARATLLHGWKARCSDRGISERVGAGSGVRPGPLAPGVGVRA